MGQDWIDFGKFRWSLVCSYMIIVEMHKIVDSNRSIEVIEPKIGVTKIFFGKYEHSVDFCIIPISMKSANTTDILSLVTGFQSHILERN